MLHWDFKVFWFSPLKKGSKLVLLKNRKIHEKKNYREIFVIG
jgi:hypothetical protein